jgi:hypothetical protein
MAIGDSVAYHPSVETAHLVSVIGSRTRGLCGKYADGEGIAEKPDLDDAGGASSPADEFGPPAASKGKMTSQKITTGFPVNFIALIPEPVFEQRPCPGRNKRRESRRDGEIHSFLPCRHGSPA